MNPKILSSTECSKPIQNVPRESAPTPTPNPMAALEIFPYLADVWP